MKQPISKLGNLRDEISQRPIVQIIDEIDPELTPGRWREHCRRNSRDDSDEEI